jgi:peptidase S41-like protein
LRVNDLLDHRRAVSSPRSLALCLTLIISAAPLPGQTSTPNTAAGRAFRAWLDAYNSGDSAQVAAFFRSYDVVWPLSNSFVFRQMTGGFDLLSVEVSEPRHIEFILRHRKDPGTAYGALDVSPGEPSGVWGTLLPLGPNASIDSLRIDTRTRARVVGRVAALLDSFYVSPQVGKQMRDSLRARLARGAYNRYANGPGLAIRLDTDLEQIARDKHLHVFYFPRPSEPRGGQAPAPSPEQERRAADENNCGFRKVEQLEGNVGYVRFDAFQEPALCASTVAAAMTFIAGTRALIVDLRENGGGKADMVALIASYLFERRTHLNDLWTRHTNHTDSFWTQDSVVGRRFGGEKPVYVLTSAHTFSGAEEFAYDLQSLKRATIVGEATAGGAHPVSDARIDDHFVLIVPWGKAINPVTGANWEGVGVVPDVKVPANEALDTAQRLLRNTKPQ